MRILICAAVLALATSSVSAQQATHPIATQSAEAPPTPTYTQLDAVTVEGAQPGPGLWQANKNGHTVWILGTVSPLPSGMQWQLNTVKDVIAQSQEVISPPDINIQANIGIFKGLFLFNRLRKMDQNPDGKHLSEVLSAPTYARWQRLKSRYMPNDKDVEKKRPMFAAGALLKAAYAKSGLSDKSLIWPAINPLIKDNKLKVTSTSIKLKIEDPAQALKEFKDETMNDELCLSSAMNLLENNIPAVKARANAWARGDVARIRQLPIADRNSDCVQALMEAQVAATRGLRNVPATLRSNWLTAVDAASARNESTFAVMSVDMLIGKDGYLASLKEKGYEIIEP
ncbi:TraB/GumN family protein [Lysobacter sp. HDW10]|uniref:TraB/GumN family protein n=1 Tax=Lysobacter sp. HDW10 TaxID=2714936 RepID=UPI001408DDB1|nr:TraB/GumN family protein [Lysobacter sp. HDW10]QIK81315.1 TraB/GumN family protein [Lysobacter sp. HDW10]